MPTENRRVAAYLPKHIDDRLEAFKVERELKGDSPALIEILSEFFGVSQEATHLSSSEFEGLSVQMEDLSLKVAHLENELLGNLKNSPIGDLKNELLSELQGELFDRLKPDLRSELIGELRGELLRITSTLRSELKEELLGELLDAFSKVPVFPNHSNSVPPGDSPRGLKSELQSIDESMSWHELKGELLPMTEAALAERFRLGNPKSLANRRAKTKDDFQSFIEWSMSKDPESKAWLYDPTLKLYHRVTQSPSSESEEF